MFKQCQKNNTIWIHLLLWWVVLFVLVSASQAYAEDEQTPTLPKYSNEELLNQMLVVDIAERSLQKLPALAITFSQDINAKEDFGKFITLTENDKLVSGQESQWIVADNPRRLYFTNIQPEQSYRVQIRPGLVASNGLSLAKPVDFKLTTRSVEPVFDFATKGSILPTKLTTGLPLRIVNVPELDFEFLRVAPDKVQAVLKKLQLHNNLDTWEMNEINGITESVYSMRYATDAKKNANETRVLPVEDIKPLQQPGLYFAVMRRPGQFDSSAYRITHFIVSNIGLHVRLYKDRLEVFANSLDQGKAWVGLPLHLQGEDKTIDAETDAEGKASFDTLPKAPLLLTAQQGEQFAFLDLRDPTLDLSDYQVDGETEQAFQPFIYSGRNLYRPGEKMDLSIILRDTDGLVVNLDKLHVRIIRPDTKVLLEETISATNPKLGYFQERITIPSDAPTGAWSAEVRLDPKAEQALNRYDFRVEDFMPERMRLTLSAGNAPLKAGEKLVVAVQGDYLYGAPASGNKVTAVLSSSIDQHPLADLAEFYFGDSRDGAELSENEDLPELTLNEKGSGFIEAPAVSAKVHSPLSLRMLVSLYETGGRTVNRTIKQSYWPADALVGIHPLFANDTVARDEPAKFELVRVDAKGTKLAATQLAVTLVRVDNEYFWEYSSSEGWTERKVVNEYPLQQRKIGIAEGQMGAVEFPVESGSYRLEVEDSSTGIKTAYAFDAGWQTAQNNNTKPDQIRMTLDKPAYQLGDTVKVTIVPPAAGEAMLTVEGDQLLWSKRVELPAAGASFDIPLDKAWVRHDLYLSAVSFRPASSKDKIAPNRALGIVYLPLDREDRKVALTITAPEKTRPEKPVVVQVSAEALKGQEALVTLSAVDEGVLNIMRFKDPDPFHYYFARHRYAVDQYDMYGKIIEFADGSALRQRFGGDLSESLGAGQQAEVQIVSLFSGPIKFDEQGNADIVLQVPGFDGALRLTALAVSEKQMGVASRSMLVASPVVASIAGPRFLANGDTSSLTVDLRNTSDTEQAVSLKLSANDALTLISDDQNYTLAKGEHKVVAIPIKAGAKPVVARVSLQLTGKDFVANRRLELNVRAPYPPQTRQRLYSITERDGEVVLDKSIIQNLMPESLAARLSVSNVPSINARSALDGLLEYPYGCLEQVSSRAYPYLFLESNVVESLGLTPMDMATRNERVQSALMALNGMQLASGGFSLWGDSSGDAETWLTPYALDFLIDAQQQGFKVPDYMVNKALDYLEEQLGQNDGNAEGRYSSSDMPAYTDFAARAYAGYVLARKSRASLGTLRTLYDNNAKDAASGLPLAQLGLALIMRGDKRRGEEALKKALDIKRDDKKYYADYGSFVRDEAWLLALLLQNQQAISNLAERTKTLSNAIYQHSYLSTQEQMAIFRLYRTLLTQKQKNWSASLTIQGQALSLQQIGDYRRVLRIADFEQGIKLKTSTAQSLYAGVEVQGYPSTAPVVRKDAVDVQRTWYDLQGHKVADPKHLPAGALLLTRIQVQAKQNIPDALLVDLLPAALEIENTHINDSADLGSVTLEDLGKSVSDILDYSSVKHEEFRDDRYLAALNLSKDTTYQLLYMVRVVSTGQFAVPPSFVQDMYRPDIFGVGESFSGLEIK